MNARIAVFAGPSLPPRSRPRDVSLTWFPPAATGDVLKIVGTGFDTVCLIDGYFDHRPAPWHKELLTVMAAGIRLIGASSMGALRAAELDGLGMEGVGAIYRAFRTGLLTGDDEVALIHGPDVIGWAAASIPMVEVRATLVEAVRSGLLTVGIARHLRMIAQDIHYTDRDWPLLRRSWVGAELVDLSCVQAIEGLHVPLKQMDAEQCVAVAMADGPRPAPLHIPQTCFLRDLQTEVSQR